MRSCLLIVFLLSLLPSLLFAEDIQVTSVSSVYDGDTFKVNLPCNISTLCIALPVRVQGIDSPEFKTKDSCEKKKAKEAKLFTRKFLNNGTVSLRNCKRDKYFRLLCTVVVTKDETKAEYSLADALLEAGLAIKYDGGKKYKYNLCVENPVLIK